MGGGGVARSESLPASKRFFLRLAVARELAKLAYFARKSQPRTCIRWNWRNP